MIDQQDLGDGIVALVLAKDGPVNTLDVAMNVALGERAAALVADPAVRGIVIASSKTDFVVGGDLGELSRASTPGDVVAIVAPFIRALRVLEKGGKPVVAAMSGSALGGGLELALACHRRIAADHASARFGLPEATLGLMPGAGGTQRLPRLIGIAAATPLLVEGKRLTAAEAKAAGLVDDIVPADQLLSAAKAWALAHPQAVQPWDTKGYTMPGFAVQAQAGRHFFTGSWARIRRGAGANNAAAEAILFVLQQGLERGLDAGIAIETRAFARLASGVDAKNRIRTLFDGVNRARRMRQRPSAPRSTVARLAVLGGGVMGRGIAQAAAVAGIAVVLIDIDDAAASRSRDEIARSLEKSAARGLLSGSPDEIVARIVATADYGRAADVDFVVEAVFERRDVKHAVLRAVAGVVGPTVPIASNTSTMPIGGLAAAVDRPERVVGLHFFSPVDRMPLVEVIRAERTDDATLVRALDFLKQLAKTPVVVNDGLGFFTSRVVTTYSSETLNLVGEGVPVALIDNAAVNAGFVIGAASLVELTTLPLLVDILASMRGDGDRIANRGNIAEATAARLVELGRHGKAAGRGLYDYGADGRDAWADLPRHFPPPDAPLDEETVRRRLFHAQSLEAVRALEDGVIADPLDGDVAAVLGWGYPAHLGGPFAYVDRIGAARFVAECDEMVGRFGGRFEAPATLRAMAADHRRFHG